MIDGEHYGVMIGRSLLVVKAGSFKVVTCEPTHMKNSQDIRILEGNMKTNTKPPGKNDIEFDPLWWKDHKGGHDGWSPVKEQESKTKSRGNKYS